MPFIAQCPYPNCRKFLLLEDEVRGGATACLLCKQPIAVSDAPPGQPPTVTIGTPSSGDADLPPIRRPQPRPGG